VSVRPKKPSRVRSMTEEDIQQRFGSGFVIGPVVRPKPEQASEAEQQRDSDDEG
jgi:hypothetical protein